MGHMDIVGLLGVLAPSALVGLLLYAVFALLGRSERRAQRPGSPPRWR
jgi:hypothetical protein